MAAKVPSFEQATNINIRKDSNQIPFFDKMSHLATKKIFIILLEKNYSILFRANSWLPYRHASLFSSVFFVFFYQLKLHFGSIAFQKFSKSSDDNRQNPGKMLDKCFPIRQSVGKLYYYQWILLTDMKQWWSYSNCLLFNSLPLAFCPIPYKIRWKSIHRCAGYLRNFVNYFCFCLIFSVCLENPTTREK